MSGHYTYPYLYPFNSDSDETHNQMMDTSIPSPWAYDARNAQTQQQTITPSQLHQGWSNTSVGYPSNSIMPTFHVLGPQANETSTFYTGMPTMFNAGPTMSQYGTINETSGQTWNMFADANGQWNQPFHSAVDGSQGYFTEVGESSATTLETDLSPLVDEDEDTSLWGTPESQESQAEFNTQANGNPGSSFNQPLPVDNSEPRSLSSTTVPQGGPGEVVSSAPFQQWEGQLQQSGEAQLTLPQLTMPLRRVQPPSSQTSHQFQAATAPSPGQGRSLPARPEEQYPTPESIPEVQQGTEPQPQTRRPRVVGKNSCERCRRSKVKCVHTPGMEKCRRCEEKGFECLVNGVDYRTNKSANDELYDVLNKKHALIQEFVALLYLLSHKGARENEEDHREARRFFRKCSPTQIFELVDKAPSEYFPVETVYELNKHRFQYETLEKRRAAIKEAEEYGSRTICALYEVCHDVKLGKISNEDVDQILRDAKYGRFRHDALRNLGEHKLRFHAASLNMLYHGTPSPSHITMRALPHYPRA